MINAPVIIAGGSLAGMAAALRLQQHGIMALVIEKSQFPRKKLCGEFLGPDSFESLMILGLWEQVREAAYGPIETVIFHPYQPQSAQPWTIPMRWLNRQKPYALGISRSVFDTLLIAHAKAQGIPVLERHKILAPLHLDNHQFEISVQPPEGTPCHFQTPILMDASGRHGGLHVSAVREKQTPQKHVGRNLVGFKVTVRLASQSPDKTLQMFFFPHGYGGVQPLSEEIHNVCFLMTQMSNASVKQPFSEFISQTMGQNLAAKRLLQDAEVLEPFQTTANLNLTPNHAQPSPLIRMGDAMLTIDPFTGSGMALALQSGILAADTVAEGLNQGWHYRQIQQAYQQRYQNLWGMRLACLKQFRPFLFSEFAQKLVWPFAKPCLPVLTKIFR